MAMTQPTLSILIPVFNGARTLPRLLDSIDEQLRPEVEVVVADNASTDRTLKIASSFSHFSRIRSTSNVGFDANLCRAVEMAKGTHCWFIGADDWLYPGAIARVLDAIEYCPAALILGDAINHRWDGVEEPHISSTVWPDLKRFDLSEPGSVAHFLSQALTFRAMLTFISNVVFPKASWPENAAQWDGTGYTHSHCWWTALLSDATGVYRNLLVRKRVLVRSTIGHPEFRNAETARYVKHDVMFCETLAAILSVRSEKDRIAVLKSLRFAYPPDRVKRVNEWCRREAGWTQIAQKLDRALRGDDGP